MKTPHHISQLPTPAELRTARLAATRDQGMRFASFARTLRARPEDLLALESDPHRDIQLFRRYITALGFADDPGLRQAVTLDRQARLEHKQKCMAAARDYARQYHINLQREKQASLRKAEERLGCTWVDGYASGYYRDGIEALAQGGGTGAYVALLTCLADLEQGPVTVVIGGDHPAHLSARPGQPPQVRGNTVQLEQLLRGTALPIPQARMYRRQSVNMFGGLRHMSARKNWQNIEAALPRALAAYHNDVPHQVRLLIVFLWLYCYATWFPTRYGEDMVPLQGALADLIQRGYRQDLAPLADWMLRHRSAVSQDSMTHAYQARFSAAWDALLQQLGYAPDSPLASRPIPWWQGLDEHRMLADGTGLW